MHSPPQPLAVLTTDLPHDGWADAARGSMGWQTIFSAPATATDSMVCGIAHLAPGQDLRAHSHPQAEIYLGLEGEGTVIAGGQTYRMAPGVALFIPGGTIHEVPPAKAAFRFFYVFAADSFDEIRYQFEADSTA